MGEPVIHLCRHAARAYLGGTMNHNIITVGSRTFTGEDLKSGSCYIAESIAGEELSIDTLDATVESAVDLTGLPYGEAVTYTHDNVLIGKFFLSSVKRVGASIYDLSCVSAVGLLAGSMHLGGLYTGQTAAVVLADIIGGMAEYTVDDKVKSVKVYGWLPYATRRDNLHQLLFAVGASITKTVAGTLNIKYLTANDPKFISTDRLYAGGSIDHSTPATEAQVTEHVYFASANDQTNTLFDNTDGSGTANNQLVTFDGPHHNLTASSGLTIVSSGVNHAVLTGTGTLTGKAYSHQTKIISKQAEAPAGTEHVVSVTDATLVSPVNSSSVTERVLAYYSGAYHATMGLVVGEERPGDSVRYTNPFEEVDTGLIKSMDINMSNTLKADTTITGGYVPTGSGNDFEHYVVLTGTGTWTVPAGIEKIRVITIGAGGAGHNGEDGSVGTGGGGRYTNNSTKVTLTDWTKGSVSTSASSSEISSGNGGSGGAAGVPGKVFETDITVFQGQSFTYSCGVAGVSEGALGEESIFGEVSSEGGSTFFGGFVDIMSGTIYAAAGSNGQGGGMGGASGSDGESVGNASGGSAMLGGTVKDSVTKKDDPTWNYKDTIGTLNGQIGNAGGGGAGGGSGNNRGTNGNGAKMHPNGTHEIRVSSTGSTGTIYGIIGGRGGNGANGADASTFGSSGGGGGGGGGAGASSSVSLTQETTLYAKGDGAGTYTLSVTALPLNSAASPGLGGSGGAGAPGCVIIYY